MTHKLLSTLNIRSGEGKTTSLLIGIMLFSAAGYTLGGTGIEALYFARFGTGLLPYLYMGLGMLSLVSTLAISGLLSRVKREHMYVYIPLIAALLLLLAWGLLFGASKAIFPALWLGKESLNTIVSMIAWNTAGAVCDSRQAKRLFPLFNGARILGSVLGGLGTVVLVEFIGTQNLVLVWAVSMGMVYGMSRILMGGDGVSPLPTARSRMKRRGRSFIIEMRKGWDYVRHSELLRWISIAAVLFSVLYFSIALPFSKSVTARYPDEEQLAGFLGLFNGLSTAAAFITSIFFANRMYARFGIMTMILALPLIYLFGFGALVFLDSLAIIVAFRFLQMLWLSGVADAAYQTMFSAIPPEKRDQVNAFLNGVPEQAGVFLAGAILIVGEQAFTSQQLYLVGLVAALATTFVIWRASSAYRGALVSSLREGRPTIFSGRATTHDSTSLAVAVESMKHPDALVRRVAAEMLGDMDKPEVLLDALRDADAEVRIAALKGLTGYAPAAPRLGPLLNDPDPAVRQQAIHTLGHSSPNFHDLNILLEPALLDDDVHVQVEAAFGLLKTGEHPQARQLLRRTCTNGRLEERVHALNAMSKLPDRDAYDLIADQLGDPSASIRCAAALALASCGEQAIPSLIASLADEDPAVRDGVARALAGIGEKPMGSVIDALTDPTRANGAVQTLSYMSINHHKPALMDFASKNIDSAVRFHGYAGQLTHDNERINLLVDSLHARARQDALQALQILGFVNDRESIQTAIENLQSSEATQRANALETLEEVHAARLIKPLLQIWESQDRPPLNNYHAQGVLTQLLREPDDWVRACAVFAAQGFEFFKPVLDEFTSDPNPLIREITSQGETMDTRTTLPVMERVLFLRRVPLLADLTPSDLQRVAALVTEHHAEQEEVIFGQGETGEEMYVIVHGEVKVIVMSDGAAEKEVARRKSGDVVGEMSIISGEPRIATLITTQETHFLCLDKKSFEGLLRERPEVSLAIMRVLCARLKEASK